MAHGGRKGAQTTMGFHRDVKGEAGKSDPDNPFTEHLERRLRASGATTVLGRAAEPAASFGYDNRKKNLESLRTSDTSLRASRGARTMRERQKARDEWTKNNEYQLPAAVSEIAAESLVLKNPLLDPSLAVSQSNYKVQSLSSLTLMDLVMLRAAFEDADKDGSAELDYNEFIQAFLPLLSADAGDVGLLFMRIDANCDGAVSWDEFLFYILSQDESALKIAAESSRYMFDYPAYVDSASQVSGHRDTCGGLIIVDNADRYLSYSRRGDLLVWKPDAIEGAKVSNPREFATNLPFITGMDHVKRIGRADRMCLSSADKQVSFVDLIRDTCKITGHVKVDFSPLCMCTVAQYRGGAFEGRPKLLAEGRVPQDVAWVDDMRVLVSGGSDGQLVLSDVTKGEVRLDGFRHRGEVHDFVWLKKVQLLASCGLERHINMWQIPIKTPVYKLEGHQASVQQLCGAGNQLVSLDTSKVILIWDLREMASIQRLEAFKIHAEHPIGRIIYDERRELFASLSRRMALWHMRKRKVPNGHTQGVTCSVYNRMFEILISADEASDVRVWDLNAGRAVLHFSGAHTSESGETVKISAMSLDHTMRRLITGAHDGSVKVWNFSTGVCLKELHGFGSGEVTAVTHMYMHPYDYMVATGWNRKVVFWMDANDGRAAVKRIEPSHDMQGHREDILCMACNHDTNQLITGAYDGDIIVWNTDSGRVSTRLILPGILSMKGENRPIESMMMLDCGVPDYVAPVRRQATMLPQLDHTGTARRNVKGGESTVLLITAGGDGTIRFWSTNATAELLLEHVIKESVETGLGAVAACAKNRVLVVSDNKGFVIVFDINGLVRSSHKALPPMSFMLTGPIEVARFSAHQAPITSLQYVNTRRLIVTTSQDCAICVWTLMGERMGTLGEEASAWKLSASMYRFEKQVDEAVFGNTAKVDKTGNFTANVDDQTGSKTKVLSGGGTGKKLVPKPTVSSDRGSSSKMATGLSSLSRGTSADKSSGDLRSRRQEASASPSSAVGGGAGGAGGGGFFLTDRPDSAEQEEDIEEGEEEWSSEEDDDSEVSDDVEEDATVQQVTEEEAHRGRLRTNIDGVVQRGMAMKERGEYFHEAGYKEMATYQKMIVRDLGSIRLPDAITKRVVKRRKEKSAL
ncbi:WD40-repeat-containing domain protein [Baffinella frigidus]|nr:WD40-repeat-containing domain protein [Cryptophyta sp. CCMP2293]